MPLVLTHQPSYKMLLSCLYCSAPEESSFTRRYKDANTNVHKNCSPNCSPQCTTSADGKKSSGGGADDFVPEVLDDDDVPEGLSDLSDDGDDNGFGPAEYSEDEEGGSGDNGEAVFRDLAVDPMILGDGDAVDGEGSDVDAEAHVDGDQSVDGSDQSVDGSDVDGEGSSADGGEGSSVNGGEGSGVASEEEEEEESVDGVASEEVDEEEGDSSGVIGPAPPQKRRKVE